MIEIEKPKESSQDQASVWVGLGGDGSRGDH